MKKILFLFFMAFFSVSLSAQAESEVKDAPKTKDRLVAFSANIQVQTGKKDWDAAIDSHNKMLEILNNNNEISALYVRLSRGRCYFEKGDYDAALIDYNFVVESLDFDPEPYLYRGELFLKKGDYDSARRDFDKAVGTMPHRLPAYRWRAELNYLTKNYESAIKDASEFINFNPKQPVGWYFRAFSYMETGEYQRALDDFNEYLKLTSGDAKVYLKRAEAFRKLGMLKEAAADERLSAELKSNKQ